MRRYWPTAGALLAVLAVGYAWSQHAGKSVIIQTPMDNDVYAAGREVEVRAPISGDLVAAGQRVIVDATVAGDVIAAAETIEIRAAVADDVRAAGDQVRLSAPVEGHVVAAGRSVTVEQAIGDWVWLAGERVEVSGVIGGDLRAAATEVTIMGEIRGDVDAIGETLRLGPGAIVQGDLRWRSDNAPDISADARVDGQVSQQPPPEFEFERSGGGAGPLWFTASVIIAVVVLYLVFPAVLRGSADAIRKRPGASFGLGLALFAATPVAIVGLMITGVGALLAVALLGVYLVLLLLGVLSGLFAVSDLALRALRPEPQKWQAVLAIVIAVVAVGLLSYVPLLGFLFVVAAWLFGLGALAVELSSSYRQAQV